jgi:putative FmdB family regulatory protein
MPTYEYVCKSCGHELEVQQSFTDDPLKVCPECDGELRKVFGNIAVTFKGSGFYKTDSRAGGAKKSDAASESKSEAKSETKSETKSESTTTKSDSSTAAAS